MTVDFKNTRGSVAYIVIMVLILVSLIGLTALTTSYYNNKLAGNEIRRKKALYIAESGAMEAIDSLNANPSVHGVIFNKLDYEGGTYTVEILDSTDFPYLYWQDRVVRSTGVFRNAVRRLEYRLTNAALGFNDIPGPLYIEAPTPHFAGNSFTVQGGDHHFGDANYNIPTPPGIPRPAVTTIHDSTSIIDAIGSRDDQVVSVDDTGGIIECSINPLYDTLDLDALADVYAGPNGELADTTDWVIGKYPGDPKVSYIKGDHTIAGGGHSPSGGGAITCSNCNGTGVVTCWGCGGSGYEWRASTCPKCNGTGRLGCTTCDSTGYLICPDCGGTGGEAVYCDSCDGTGIYGCSYCGGTGVCPICGGTGYSKIAGGNKWSCYRCGTGEKNDPPGTGVCPDCGGTGGIACPFCGGTGIDPSSGCPTCGGTGTIPCPDCGGTGYVKCDMCGGSGGLGADRICHVCGGSGVQPCPWCEGLGTVPEEGGGHGKKGTLGAGVLVIDGNLHISGQFEFTGLVIVLGDV